MTEARITINEIRSTLNCEVARDRMTQQEADKISRLLGLDWKEEAHNKRKDMDCFLEDLRELFQRYDAVFSFEGQYRGEIIIHSSKDHERVIFGDTSWFDKEFISLIPRMYKRSKMVQQLKFCETDRIEDIKPIFDAIRKVDRKYPSTHVTDKKFKEMIDTFKSKRQ